MRKYECTYLVSDEVREGDLNKVTGSVNGFVTGLGGKIVKEDIWGRRKLAYPIKKADFATYVTLFFDLPADKAFELDRDLRQTTAIMRHLTIIKEHGHEAITLSASEIAETAEIEEVIGGEKSFEAVEGQTEESFDLMAKREVEEEPSSAPLAAETTDGKPEELKAGDETPKTLPSSAEATDGRQSPQEDLIEEKAEADEKMSDLPEKPHPSPELRTAGKIPRKPRVAKTPKIPELPNLPESPESPESTKSSDEAERLSKLNEELDDILKDEL